jgi:hypothetical protein
MNKPREHASSGKSLATLASVVGLALVWSVVWANLPSWDELQSAQPRVPAAPAVPELDLTIPGVPSRPPHVPSRLDGARKSTAGVTASGTVGGNFMSRTMRAGQVAEMKCAAEVQESCPDTLTRDEQQQCLERRMSKLSAPCQAIAQNRMVRWKEGEAYKVACAEDVKRVCWGLDAEDGNLLACLQTREQVLSLGCYQSLPKGQIQLRN